MFVYKEEGCVVIWFIVIEWPVQPWACLTGRPHILMLGSYSGMLLNIPCQLVSVELSDLESPVVPQ